MTRRTMAALVSAVLLSAPAAAQSASPHAGATSPGETATLRADALLGLARVARDAGDAASADRYFRESAHVRAFDRALHLEHFWVIAEVDVPRAVAAARALADAGVADVALFDRWIGLTLKTRDAAALAEAAARAQRAVPGLARWPRRLGESLLQQQRPREAAAAFAQAAESPDGTIDDVAMRALALERAGALPASADAWDHVPGAVRRQHADWWASALRTHAVRDGRAALADDLVAYVDAHTRDVPMRLLAVEALADADRPDEALALLTPIAGRQDVAIRRRIAALTLAAGDAARATVLYEDLERTGEATVADRWQVLALTAATAPSSATLARLAAVAPGDDRCRTRAVGIADIAGSGEIAAWVATARPADCAVPEGLALEAARWLTTAGDDTRATMLLARAFTKAPASRALALTLAARHLEDGDGTASRAVLDRHLAQPGATLTDELRAARAWALAAEGEAAPAWALVADTLARRPATPAEAAGWAGLAFAAGADADADRLARLALGSARDVDARQLLASMAQRRGDARHAYDWLAPVADRITSPVQMLPWLDALADLHGPSVALAEGRRLWRSPMAESAAGLDVAVRLARWATASGWLDDADAYVAVVEAHDVARAARLRLERDVADGRAAQVVAQLSAAPTALDLEGLRLLVTAALDSGAWPPAVDALDEWQRRDADAHWGVLKAAELAIKRDGRLDEPQRQQLQALVAQPGATADEARIRLAQDASARGAHAAALDVLGWDGSVAPMTPVAVRRALADALDAAGEPEGVLLALPDGTAWPPDLLSARARALVTLGRPEAAKAVIERMPPARRRADDWQRLATVTAAPAARVAVLEESLAHVAPDRQAALLAALATVQQQLGRPAAARDTALRALALDPHLAEAWRVRLAVSPATAAERADDLRAAEDVVAQWPDVAVDLAEAALAAGTPGPDEAGLIDGWIERALRGAPARAWRLRVRVAVATGDWPVALDALTRARASDPDDRGLQRLEAQVYAWSGDHPAAARRFADYLAAVPADGQTWREYGRLLAWMQQHGPAQRAYAEAARLLPDPALDAEARTKEALARESWAAAVAAAADWQALEPDSLDARMDHARALDRQGDVHGAARLYADLASSRALPHDLRVAAGDYGRRHRAEASLSWSAETAEGFGGQQRLEQHLMRAAAGDRIGLGGALRASASVGRGVLDGGTAGWDQTFARADVEARLRRGWSAAGGAAMTWLSREAFAGRGSSQAMATVQGRLTRQVTNRLRVAVSAEHKPFWENAATVQDGLSASGGGADVSWRAATPVTLQGYAHAHRLSDGNRRQEAGGSVAWRGSRGDYDLGLRASGFAFGYAHATSRYFTPRGFARTDLEGELRHWFGRPRSDADRQAYVGGGAGLGVDSRGARYGLAQARASLPVHPSWTLVGEGRWVQADVYESSRLAFWLQFGR